MTLSNDPTHSKVKANPNDQKSKRIVVVAINGDKVKLGFEATKDVSIHRQEIYDKIQQLEKAD